MLLRTMQREEIARYCELLLSLTRRQLKARYKQSMLGASWAIFQPLSLMVIFTVVFSKFANIPSDGIPYPIFSYSGLLPWTLFATSLSTGVPSVVSNASLLTKVRIPTEIMPVASMLAALVDFFVAGLVFIGLMFIYQVQLTFYAIYLFPLLLVQLIFTLSLVLFASAINVFFRDIIIAVPLILQLWMFATPIIYPISVVPAKYHFIYMLNPMAPIVDGYRRILTQARPPDFECLGIGLLLSIILLVLGFWFFKNREKYFADVV